VTAFPFDALLFDMDGLLVDTEPLWLETETEVMARLGAPWAEADQQALLGGSMARTVAYLLSRATRALPARGGATPLQPPEKSLPTPEVVASWMREGMLERAAAGRVTERPGARELIAATRGSGVPCALVTS